MRLLVFLATYWDTTRLDWSWGFLFFLGGMLALALLQRITK